MKKILAPIKNELAAVEKGLRGFSRSGNRLLDAAVLRVLASGGKRLRPALLLLSAKACNYTGAHNVRLAMAMELIHTASLIHDDVIDNAPVRRGSPTINMHRGNRASILAGDSIYTRVFSILAEIGNQEILRTVARTTQQMVDGEISQTLGQKNRTLTEKEYEVIISHKTAALFSCACKVGALLGPRVDGEVKSLADYGRNLGMAFQITDDLLDVVGNKKQLGKQPGNDICEGKFTLPFIHILDVADRNDKQWVRKLFGSRRISPGVLSRVQNLLRHYGGIDYSIHKAQEYIQAGKEHLRKLKPSAERDALLMLADQVLGRVN